KYESHSDSAILIKPSTHTIFDNHHKDITDVFFVVRKNHFLSYFNSAKKLLISALVLRNLLTKRPISLPFSVTTKLGIPKISQRCATSINSSRSTRTKVNSGFSVSISGMTG